jgi:acyl-CoA synthetase (AMP-forming)/AMP-acid ligase II
VHRLRRHAVARGGATAFRLLHGPSGALSQLSFGQLDRLVDAAAAWLRFEQGEGVTGQRVVLLFEPGLEFVVAFLACMRAGCVAVPLRPPRTDVEHASLQGIVRKVDARLLLVDAATRARGVHRGVCDEAGCRLRVLDWLQDASAVATILACCDAEDADGSDDAFLQFTSGSTGDPKGVVVRHDHILANQQVIEAAFGHDQRTTTVSWLPHFHDMGLIGTILQPLYLGRPCHLMAPATFLQRPLRWLRAIADAGCVTSGGPNFAFQHCVTSITDRELENGPPLDLSGWRLAFVGAEPVRAETMRRFVERFARFGFDAGALYPCYGLAESTLMVTGGDAGQGVRARLLDRAVLDQGRVQPAEAGEGSVEVVSCGRVRGEQQVVVVDPDRRVALPDGEVGELWVRGPSVAAGYYQDEAATRERFAATLRGDDPARYLRTGDLGFVQNGELFVTGRLGSRIILNGRKFYPQDVEAGIAALHPSFRAGGTAAFAVATETGANLVIVQEVRGRQARDLDAKAVLRAARAQISSRFGVRLHDLVLTRDSLLRTSSGKLRHAHNRQCYLGGGFRRLATSPPRVEHA